MTFIAFALDDPQKACFFFAVGLVCIITFKMFIVFREALIVVYMFCTAKCISNKSNKCCLTLKVPVTAIDALQHFETG